MLNLRWRLWAACKANSCVWGWDGAAGRAIKQLPAPFSRFGFFQPVSHFPSEKGTGRLVEIRNGNVKVSTYCIKFFQINASIKLSMIFHIKQILNCACLPVLVWSFVNISGIRSLILEVKIVFNQIFLFHLLFFALMCCNSNTDSFSQKWNLAGH